MGTHEAPRVEVPKPHMFGGKRDAKELDNFLWHMERYFEVLHWQMKPLQYAPRPSTSPIMLLYDGIEGFPI